MFFISYAHIVGCIVSDNLGNKFSTYMIFSFLYCRKNMDYLRAFFNLSNKFLKHDGLAKYSSSNIDFKLFRVRLLLPQGVLLCCSCSTAHIHNLLLFM